MYYYTPGINPIYIFSIDSLSQNLYYSIYLFIELGFNFFYIFSHILFLNFQSSHIFFSINFYNKKVEFPYPVSIVLL